MKIRWSPAAADDLQHISDYLRQRYPRHRQPTIERIYAEIRSLKDLPNRGRQGRRVGTREMFLLRLPYVVVYRVRDERVEILRILHTSQDWH